MLVVDVETTGTNGELHSIVSIGAVDFSNPKDTFYVECRVWDGAHIEDQALSINGYSREEVLDQGKVSDREAVEMFLRWVDGVEGDHMVAGLHPSFDESFLKHTAHRYHINWPMAKRMIDLHSVCFAHIVSSGRSFPFKNKKSDIDSDKIMDYVGIPHEPKPHIAINGAKWETEAFSRLLFGKSLLPEFKDYPVIFKDM